jgi:hypothetical protein
MSHNHDAGSDPLASCPHNLAQEGDVPPPPKKKCTEVTDGEGNIRIPHNICVPLTVEVADIKKLIDLNGYMGVFPTQVKML